MEPVVGGGSHVVDGAGRGDGGCRGLVDQGRGQRPALQDRLCLPGPEDERRHRAERDARHRADAAGGGERQRHAGDGDRVALAASELVEGIDRRHGQARPGNPGDQLVGPSHVALVVEEVPIERQGARRGGAGQRDVRVQREQRRHEVRGGRPAGDVAGHGGGVAHHQAREQARGIDERGRRFGDLRRFQQVGDGGASADRDSVGTELHAPQLADRAESDHAVGTLAPGAHVDDQVGAPGDGDGLRVPAGGEDVQGAGEVAGHLQLERCVHCSSSDPRCNGPLTRPSRRRRRCAGR